MDQVNENGVREPLLHSIIISNSAEAKKDFAPRCNLSGEELANYPQLEQLSYFLLLAWSDLSLQCTVVRISRLELVGGS